MSENNSQTAFRGAALLLAAVLLAGCGGSPKLTPADPKKAVSSLQMTLEKWKNGTSIDALRQEKPAVYVVDEDWQAGLKLASFQLRDVIDQGGVTARIPVRLDIQSPNGLWSKEVEYRVQTEPVISIVREFE